MVITLVAVMGIAWIGNVLFFDVHLIFVAYIMTVIIACQGIIIFILFVPLSKQVWTISIQLFRSPISYIPCTGERCLHKMVENQTATTTTTSQYISNKKLILASIGNFVTQYKFFNKLYYFACRQFLPTRVLWMSISMSVT